MPRQLLVALAALSLAGCFTPVETVRSGDGGVGRDAAVPMRSDAGACVAQCGSGCCTADQLCVNGSCVSCSCGGKVCGTDACGNSCGVCPMPQTCDPLTGRCVTTCPLGQTACGTACCTAGQTCVAGLCESPDACYPSCTGTTPVCDDGVCKCSSSPDSCGGGVSQCIGGVCCAVPCADVCCIPGQFCLNNTCSGDCGGGVACDGACCAPGQTCTNGVCTTPGCNGCTSGETCNSATDKCECSPRPDSCALATSGSFRCDQSTLLCAPWSAVQSGCTGCTKGQACVVVVDIGSDNGPGKYLDPYTDTSGPRSCSCVPSGYSASQPLDSCEAVGMVCDDSSFDATTPTAMSCRNPGDGEDCLKGITASCLGTGLTCDQLTDTQGDVIDLCLQICTDTSACANLVETCKVPSGIAGSTKYCVANFCAQPWTLDYSNQTGKEDPSQRSNYFKTCNAAGVGDGWCTPYWERGWDESGKPQYVDIGYCIQGGAAQILGACDPYADRSSLTQVCPAGELCQAVSGNPTAAPVLGNFKGVCRGECNAAPSPSPSASCASGFTCLDQSYGAQSDALCADTTQPNYQSYCGWLQEARLGLCQPACNVFTKSPTCPLTDAQGNATGCEPIDLTGGGLCVAVSPTAKNLNQAGCATQSCTTNADCAGNGGCVSYSCQTDLRQPCKGDAMCMQTTQTSFLCVGFCNTATCPPASGSDESAACAGCTPPDNYCMPDCYPTGFNMGVYGSQYCAYCCSGGCDSSNKCTAAPLPELGFCMAKE